MLANVLQNLWAFIMSVPINLVIILIICIFLKIFGKPFIFLVKVFVGYFLICFLLSLFGFSLPSIPAIIDWIKDLLQIGIQKAGF